MNRSGKVYYQDYFAGVVEEKDGFYVFTYNEGYLEHPETFPISLTLPKQVEPYVSKTMIPFFDGLIPEGWLLRIITTNWKIDQRDRMGLLLATCKDCIGCVSIIEDKNDG